MAVIIHRCTCGHPDFFHRGSGCDMDCMCKAVTPIAEPEVIPTWDALGKPVSTITKPGESYNRAATCNCDSCKALYEDLGGVAA